MSIRSKTIGAVAVVVGIVLAFIFWPLTGPLPQDVVAPTGEHFTVLQQQVARLADGGDAYRATLYVPKEMSDSEAAALEATAFAKHFGVLAEQYGYNAVVVKHTADKNAFRKRWWPFPSFSLSFKVNFGNAPEATPPTIYRQGADGAWTRDGAGPEPAAYLAEYPLPSGVKYGLAYKESDDLKGMLIYDCLSCGTATNIPEATRGLRELIKGVALPEAENEGLKQLDVLIFTGRRQSQWRFPFVLRMHFVKKGKSWTGPDPDPKTWQALATKKLQDSRRHGDEVHKKLSVMDAASAHFTVRW